MKKTVKKTAIFTIFVMLVAAACLALAGCGMLGGGSSGGSSGGGNGAHEHNMSFVAEVPATCEGYGNREYWSCSICGKSYSDSEGKHELSYDDIGISPTGHTPETVPGTPASCSEQGYTDGQKCSVCQKVISAQTVIPTLPHTDDNNDCICDVCGAPAHHYGEWIADVQETCGVEGKYHRVCELCNNRDNKTVNPLVHQYEKIPAVAATCAKPGSTEGIRCKNCGEVLTEPQVVPALEHRFRNGVCTVCGQKEPTSSLSLYEIYGKDGTTIVAYGVGRKTINEVNITIPSTYKGLPVTEIGEYAFGSKTFAQPVAIESVEIPASITRIRDNAFYDCPTLTSVTFAADSACTEIGKSAFASAGISEIELPDGLLTIGESAFNGCDLTTVTLPSKLSNLGKRAFYDCDKLETVEIVGRTGMTMGAEAFGSCSKLASVRYDVQNVAGLTNSSGVFSLGTGNKATTTVTIGSKVSAIPANLFAGWEYLNAVVFADGGACKSIAAGAFKGCKALSSVNYGDECDISDIGADAFYECEALGPLVMPDSFASIGARAFQKCKGMTSVTFCEGLTDIGEDAFRDCTAIATINFNSTYLGGVGQLVGANVFNGSGLASNTRLKIGKGVKILPKGLFASSNVRTVEFATGGELETIGMQTFMSCKKLESITLPDTVKNIGTEAFKYSALGSIVLDNGIQNIYPRAFMSCNSMGWMRYNIVNYSGVACDNIFAGCSNSSKIFTVYVGANVQSIPARLFKNDTQIAASKVKLSIPETGALTTIGESAFYGAANLDNIIIPVDVTSIGNSAFEACTAVTRIDYYAEEMDGFAAKNKVFDSTGRNDNTGAAVYFSSNVTKIPSALFRAFYETSSSVGRDHAPKITEVHIDNANLTEIGANAFRYCYDLEKVYITNVAAWCATVFNDNPISAKTSGADLYVGSTIAETLTIPSGVTTINEHAFSVCRSIKKLVIPASFKHFQNNVFNNCIQLNSVYITDLAAWCAIKFDCETASPLYYCSNMYLNNSKIIDLVIPNGVTEISDYAFIEESFNTVTLPTGLTTIGEYAFTKCKATTLSLPASVTTIKNGAFNAMTQLTRVNIPSLEVWCNINFVSTGSNPIGGYVGNGQPGLYVNDVPLTAISVPEGTTAIKAHTYAGLDVSSISLPTTLKVIGEGAFEKIHGTTSVTIPAGVTDIGTEAFYNSSVLSAYVPSSVTNMGARAFGSCGNIVVTCQFATRPASWATNWIDSDRSGYVHWTEAV